MGRYNNDYVDREENNLSRETIVYAMQLLSHIFHLTEKSLKKKTTTHIHFSLENFGKRGIKVRILYAIKTQHVSKMFGGGTTKIHSGSFDEFYYCFNFANNEKKLVK